jgi:hypothetical protein
MNKNLVKVTATLNVFVGPMPIVYGMVFDPFSIPFRNYAQLPDAVKLLHENKSQRMQAITRVGVETLMTAFLKNTAPEEAMAAE